MASTEEKTQQDVSKSKIPWKLLPEFFRRKKSDRNCVKKKPEETVSVRKLVLTHVTPATLIVSLRKMSRNSKLMKPKILRKTSPSAAKSHLGAEKV